MPDISDIRLERAKQIAVEQLITGIVTGSKTTGLYREGHPIIMQICERAVQLLGSALGQDQNITFDIQAKKLSVNDAELPESTDLNTFAATLHTLGVGQILFTNRLLKEGMFEFFKILIWKADEKTTLTDIQKAVQQLRIDGMQMTFVLSFVVTGEQAPADQPPGQLTEEQVEAFIAARTLPDFLTLLLRQNEPLSGKEAESVTAVLDQVLNREISLEKFSEQMPWGAYDPRIKTRYDAFVGRAKWQARPRGAGARAGQPRDGWDAARAISANSLFLDGDVAAIQDHAGHDKNASLAHAITRLHQLFEHGRGERQAKFVVQTYARLLIEMSRDGDVLGLLREFAFWQTLESRPELAGTLKTLTDTLREKLPSAPFASRLVERLSSVGPETEEFGKMTALLLFLGEAMLPLLLEELRRLADKHARARLAALITTICLQWGAKPLLESLKDEDYFLVSQVVLILGNLGSADYVDPVVPLLRHRHERVRESARRVLAKLGGPVALDAIAAFLIATEEEEEAKQAATALSLMNQEGVDQKLVEAFALIQDYDIRVHIATAMSRVTSALVEEALTKAAKRTLWERITGRNKDLAEAATKSLGEIETDRKLHAHGTTS